MAAKSATVPLCTECNRDFGVALETPVSRIFDDIESGRGLSDNEAELLVRWLWKLEGLLWIAQNPDGDYSPGFKLRERILRPIGQIRGDLVLALARVARIDRAHGDKPMGIDSAVGGANAIFVSGVFSELAVMVLMADFIEMIPEHFTRYRLAPSREETGDAKLIFPKTGFADDNEAVFVTVACSGPLDLVHEEFAQRHACRA